MRSWWIRFLPQPLTHELNKEIIINKGGGRNMAIVLTNGKYYIAHDATGKIIKVRNKSEAQDFHSVKRAIDTKKKCCGRTKGYYVFNTALDKIQRKGPSYVLTDGKNYIGYDHMTRKNIVVNDYDHSVKLKYTKILNILKNLSEELNITDWKIVSSVEIEEDLSSVKNLNIERLLKSESLFDIGFITLSKRKIYLLLELAQVERKVTDICHAMEFHNYNVCNGFKMYKLLQERLHHRRKIKDEIQKIEYIVSGIFEELPAGQILENISGMDHRQYHPRVLKELFEM